MESIRVFFGSDLSLETWALDFWLRPCVVECRSSARSSFRPLLKRILSGSVLFLNVIGKGVRNWFDEEIFIYWTNHYLNDRVESVYWEFIHVEILIFFYVRWRGESILAQALSFFLVLDMLIGLFLEGVWSSSSITCCQSIECVWLVFGWRTTLTDCHWRWCHSSGLRYPYEPAWRTIIGDQVPEPARSTQPLHSIRKHWKMNIRGF
jgi:hypothetical protein